MDLRNLKILISTPDDAIAESLQATLEILVLYKCNNCAFCIDVQLYISVFYLLHLEKVKMGFKGDCYYTLCIIHLIESNVMDKLTSHPLVNLPHRTPSGK